MGLLLRNRHDRGCFPSTLTCNPFSIACPSGQREETTTGGRLGKEARRQPPTRPECSIDPSVISLLADYPRGPSYASTHLALQRPRAWPGPVTCTFQGKCTASLVAQRPRLLGRHGFLTNTFWEQNRDIPFSPCRSCSFAALLGAPSYVCSDDRVRVNVSCSVFRD
jgi:hypothetical protein